VLAERVIVSIGEVIFDLVSVPACDFEGKTKRQRGIDDYLVCSPSIISTIVVHVVKLDLENQFVCMARIQVDFSAAVDARTTGKMVFTDVVNLLRMVPVPVLIP